eukprot:UN07911
MFEFPYGTDISKSKLAEQLPKDPLTGRACVVGDLITCSYDSASSSDTLNLDHTGAIYNEKINTNSCNE